MIRVAGKREAEPGGPAGLAHHDLNSGFSRMLPFNVGAPACLTTKQFAGDRADLGEEMHVLEGLSHHPKGGRAAVRQASAGGRAEDLRGVRNLKDRLEPDPLVADALIGRLVALEDGRDCVNLALVEGLAAVPDGEKSPGSMDRDQGVRKPLPHGLIIRVLDQLDEEPAVILGTDVFRGICELKVVRVPVRDAGNERVEAAPPQVNQHRGRAGNGDS
jgi:hypothetical protein